MRVGCVLTGFVFVAMTAQAAMVELVKVNLPYATTVGTVTLPAGDYSIYNTSSSGDSTVLEIRSASGKTAVTALASEVDTRGDKPADQTRVELERTGDTYRLDKIWIAGQSFGFGLLR